MVCKECPHAKVRGKNCFCVLYGMPVRMDYQCAKYRSEIDKKQEERT